MPTPARPRVAVWREVWLADSETFIRDQVAALTRWEPYRIGLRRRDNVLGVEPDLAPLRTTRVSALRTKALGSVGLVGRLADAVLAADAQLVHAHFGTGAVQALPVARRADLPLVATFHGYDATRAPDLPWGVGRTYRRRLRAVFEYASSLVAVSHFIAERLVDLGAPPEAVRVLPIGIDLHDDDGSPYPPHRRGVVFVGRLVEKKGVADLLAAVASLDTTVRESTELRIVGDGPLRAELQRTAARHGIRATFLGHLTPEQVRDELASAQVFAAPSRTADDGDAEGFGMVFLEAAAQGAPVVAYRHGGVGEAVVDGQTGLLAREGDVTALARNLRTLLTDPERADELGSAGRARVRAEFDIRRRTAALEDLYDSVAARPKAAP